MDNAIRIDRRSGAIRDLNVIDVFLFNVFGYSLGLALTTNPAIIGNFAPSSNIYMVLALGLLAAIINGVTYGMLSEIYPKTGGDYVYVGQTLGECAAFVASVGFTVAQLYGLALDCRWMVTQAFLPGFFVQGVSAHSQSIITILGKVSAPIYLFGLITLYMLVIGCVASFTMKASRWFFIFAFIVALSGTMLQAYSYFHTSPGAFPSIFNAFMVKAGAPISYQSIVNDGLANKIIVVPSRWLSESLEAAPLGFLVFLGFTYSSYIGSEVKTSGRPQTKGILAALFFGAVCFFAVMGRYSHVVGSQFNASLPVTLTAGGVKFSPSLTFFSAILLEHSWMRVWMVVGNLLWFVLVPVVILQVCSRNIQMWAVRYTFPEIFSKINRWGAPRNAVWIAIFVGWLFVICTFRTEAVLIAAVTMVSGSILMAGLAAVFVSVWDKRRFDLAPIGTRTRLYGIPVIAVFGALTVVVFLYMCWASVHYAAVGGLNIFAVTISSSVYILAGIYFFLRRRWLREKLKGQDIDPDDLWRSPPRD